MGILFATRYVSKVGMDNAYYVSPKGISGGITLWCRVEINVSIKSTTNFFIVCDVRGGSKPNLLMITWVYSNVDPQRRKQNWHELKYIGRGCGAPWVCMRYFNEICHQHENKGGK